MDPGIQVCLTFAVEAVEFTSDEIYSRMNLIMVGEFTCSPGRIYLGANQNLDPSGSTDYDVIGIQILIQRDPEGSSANSADVGVHSAGLHRTQSRPLKLPD